MYRSHHFADLPELWLAHDKSALRYRRAQLFLWLIKSLFPIGVIVGLSASYRLLGIQQSLYNSLGNGFLAWLAFFFLVVILAFVSAFLYRNAVFITGRFFGRTNIELVAVQARLLKASLIDSSVVSLFVLYYYFASLLGGSLWWLFLAFFSSVGLLITQRLRTYYATQYLDKMIPVENENVRRRVLKIFAELKLAPLECCEVDSVFKSQYPCVRILGKSGNRRVYFAKEYFSVLSPDEIQALFGHRLASSLQKTRIKEVIGITVQFLFLAFIASWICNEVLFEIYFVKSSEIFGMGIFLMAALPIYFPLSIINHWMKRKRELLSDEFVSKELGLGLTLASAIEKVTIYDKNLFVPHPIWEALFSVGTAPWKRILSLREEAIHH